MKKDRRRRTDDDRLGRVLSVRVDGETIARLEDGARREGTRLSDHVRSILRRDGR